MDEGTELTDRSGPAKGDLDRLEVLEQQVRQLTSRLAGWVEAQLVQALEDRRSGMKALRTELQVVVNEQLAGIRAESASTLSVATRRLELAQEQLSARLDAVAERASDPSGAHRTKPIDQRLARLRDEVEARLAAVDDRHRAELDAVRSELRASPSEARQRAARIIPANDGLEQRVRGAMSRLSESVEAKLAEVAAARRSEVTELRELIDGATRQAALAAEGVRALRSDPGPGAPALEALEQRLRSAMGRLSDSVETRLADLETTRHRDLDAHRAELQAALAQQGTELRTDVTTASSALRARVGQVQERIEGLEEEHRQADDRFGRMVEAKLTEVVDRRQVELDEMRFELQATLAKQLSEARADIGTSVSDAHRRFLDSVDRLDERIGLLDETLTSNGRRIESLELHTRRTDDRLTDLVDAKLGELVDRRVAELEATLAAQVRDARIEIGSVVADARLTELVDARLSEIATERIAELDEFRAQLRNALDAHLAETRADVAAAVVEGREELAARAARLDRLGAALAAARERLAESVEVKLADVDSLTERLAKTHDEMAAMVASAGQTASQARDELQAGLKTLGAQVDAIAAATAKAAFAEEGALAPVRSDVRMLHAQLAELGQLVAELRPRPKAPAGPSKAEERARALAVKRAAVAKPAPAKTTKAVTTPAPTRKPAKTAKPSGGPPLSRRSRSG
ncbi:MAG: hypothetical protein M3326_12460 [Actinomycetota bacterium]|nr:hypothetical protein [Actinomycetota bacterium]